MLQGKWQVLLFQRCVTLYLLYSSWNTKFESKKQLQIVRKAADFYYLYPSDSYNFNFLKTSKNDKPQKKIRWYHKEQANNSTAVGFKLKTNVKIYILSL